MEASRFFQVALDLISAETKKLESFCDTLDKNPTEKKNRITEYKCAKYRYAGATNLWCRFFHSHRVASKNANHHYLLPDINNLFVSVTIQLHFSPHSPFSTDFSIIFKLQNVADVYSFGTIIVDERERQSL